MPHHAFFFFSVYRQAKSYQVVVGDGKQKREAGTKHQKKAQEDTYLYCSQSVNQSINNRFAFSMYAPPFPFPSLSAK